MQLASAEPSSCVVTCERENSSMQHLHHEEVLNLPQNFHPARDLQMKLHVDGIQDEAIDLKVRFELNHKCSLHFIDNVFIFIQR